MRWRRLGLLYVFLLGVAVSCPALAQDCTKFAILDRHSSRTDSSTYELIKDVFHRQTVHDTGSAMEAGLSAGIPVPVLKQVFDITFGANVKSSDWSHWEELLYKSHYSEVATYFSTSSLSEVFSDSARKTVEACLGSTYAYFDVDASGQSFTFYLHAQGTEILDEAYLTSDSGNLSGCNLKHPFGSTIRPGAVISGKTFQVSCEWKQNKFVKMTIALKNKGVLSPKLSPLPPLTIGVEVPKAAPEMVVDETPSETYGPYQRSGYGSSWSDWYEVCTPDKPEGWSLVGDKQYSLDGNRSCGAYSECTSSQNSKAKFCFKFKTQGGGVAGGSCLTDAENKGGLFRAPIPVVCARGKLRVFWQHPK